MVVGIPCLAEVDSIPRSGYICHQGILVFSFRSCLGEENQT